MAYFKQLTGSKLPKPVAKKFKVGDNKFEYPRYLIQKRSNGLVLKVE
jgi:hypothetical protein